MSPQVPASPLHCVWTDLSRNHSKLSLRNVFITNVLSAENITIIWYISAPESWYSQQRGDSDTLLSLDIVGRA